MFKIIATSALNTARRSITNNGIKTVGVLSQQNRFMSKHSTETDAEFDARYEKYFQRTDIDGWDIRQAMNELAGLDLIPDPKIVIAALKACRRVNDYAMAVRFLETVKFKCGPKVGEIYPYIIEHIQPTLTELGIETPEQLGYDKPELALANVYDIH